jgi:hypothetical protein
MLKAGVKADPGTAVRSLVPLLLAMLLLTPAETVSEPVSFAADVEPILTQHCVMCHLPGAAQGDHSLYPDAWASMVNVPSVQSPMRLVEPGKPEASYSYLKLTGEHLDAGGSGEIMPFPNGPLSTEEIGVFRLWIEQGAGRN